ncbi:hypothetical protein B9Z65_1620 [Elsinoe australis]|uniref:Uncharacterized protein n=1 Tax=Elsinoe australis TaxID=40998 RepID=A0A2P7YGF8_9PEZI|nr:hypothetical protein B9Z65_1620 [Elsinoe australis]
MASLGPNASAEEIDDEIMFQQTLLESLQDAPDDDETKTRILATIEELEKRLENSGSNSSRQSAASDTEPTMVNDSDDSLSAARSNKRPFSTSFDDREPKRHATGFTSSQAAHNKSVADRALQRQKKAEELARQRRQIEETDAAFAMALSQQGESSGSAAARPISSATEWDRNRSHPGPQVQFGTPSTHRPLPSHARDPPTSQPPRATFQTSLNAPPRIKSESHRSPSRPPSQINRSSEIVDLTGDDPLVPATPSQQQPNRYPNPNFGSYARPIGYSHLNHDANPELPQDRPMAIPGSYPTTMDQLRAGLDPARRAHVDRFEQTHRGTLEQYDRHRIAQMQRDIIARNSGSYVYGQPSSSSHHQQPRAPPSIYEPQNQQVNRSYFDQIRNSMSEHNRTVNELAGLINGSSQRPGKPFDDGWDNEPAFDPAELTEDLKNLMDNIRPDEELPIEEQDVEVERMTVKLKPYQGVGLTWLQNNEEGTNKGGILADDMGLGKTVQAIALMTTRRSQDPAHKTTLILCPVALLRQWKEEITNKLKRGQHSMSVFVHHGAQKKKTHSELRAFDVVLTTFGTVASEMRKRDKFLARKEMDRQTTERPDEKCIFIGPGNRWYRVIVDEAQNIKNRNTQSSRGACHLMADHRLCMTGTPMMNSVDELYSLIKFLRIRPYNDWTKFNHEFSRPIKSSNDDFRGNAMKKLQALLKAILLRRHKKSTINGKPILVLPERIVEETKTEFSEEERDFYNALETQQRIQFNKYVKAGTVGRSYAHILVMLLRLRQACCHPHLVKDFGVQMAADISEDTMVQIAEELDPGVVERIKNSKGEFECPVCYDAVDNPAIFVPCGHDTCAECYVKIKESAQNGEHAADVGQNRAKCPNCRGVIDPKQVIDYETFKKVHLTQPVEEDPPEAGPSAKTGSETETDPDATESEDEGDDVDDSGSEEDETESETESLDGFVVDDDVADEEDDSKSEKKKRTNFMRKSKPLKDDDETESEDESPSSRRKGEAPKMHKMFQRPGTKPFDSDEEGDSETLSESEPKKRRKSSNPLAIAMDPSASTTDDKTPRRHKKRKSKKAKSKKSKGKGKGKGKAPAPPRKKRAQQKTIAELKKLATRSRAAKREYLQRIRKDFIDSAKVSKAVALLRHIIEETDEKIIVFSQWTSLLDLLEVPIDEAGWSYTRYDGSMPAKSRADAVDEFKDPTRRVQMRLMLVSLKAGNAGLNLNCASQVIILDPFWNPYIEEQAIDRAHRLGQEREVRVHRLLVEETVEDRILKLQEDKRAMINEALDEGAAQRLSRLSQQELGYLFGVRARPA